MVIFLQIFFIAFSLAIDTFGVSVIEGMKSHRSKTLQAFKVAAFFGIFQAVMPLVGWFIGELIRGIIFSVDHWVAFILLGGIGLKMLWEGLSKEGKNKDIANTKVLILLSIATSIDALIIGITLPLLKVPPVVSIGVIGFVTFVLSFLGFIFGRQMGAFFGKKIEVLGGLALIVIGIKILIEHLII